jgi:hypothetical protein
MARIPEQFTGDLCPHGVPKEFGSQCNECEAKKKPIVDISGVRPKINLTEAEIDELISRIDKGEITGELIQFKVSEDDQKRPVAVSREEVEEAPVEEKESNMKRLKREAGETAQELVDTLMTGGNISAKINSTKDIINSYLDVFTDHRAKMIGRRFLGVAMSELSKDMSETSQAEMVSIMQSLGLKETKLGGKAEFTG